MRRVVRGFILTIAVATALPALAVRHATEGVVTRVDAAAKEIAVKTADGTEEVFKFTENTAMHVAKETKAGAVDSYLKGKEGTHVVVHYTGTAADKTAIDVEDLGRDTVQVGSGTITGFDKAGHTLTIKAEDGSEATYRLAENTTVDTEHGVVKGAQYAGKKGEKVSVHYTEEAGEKVAHLIKHM